MSPRFRLWLALAWSALSVGVASGAYAQPSGQAFDDEAPAAHDEEHDEALPAARVTAAPAEPLPGSLDAKHEPWLLHFDGAIAFPMGTPQSDLFSTGVSGAVGVSRPLFPALLLGGRLRGTVVTDGRAPRNPDLADPDVGAVLTLSGFVRLRPAAGGDGIRRGTGPWFEGGVGVSLTGELVRASFELALGWGVEAGSLSLGPALRFIQLLQPDSAQALDANDGRLGVVGLEILLLDRRPPPLPAIPARDRDSDGILDRHDECPTIAEDDDGFEDEDGCPEQDNDRDSVPDSEDSCPMLPEDRDDYEDADGCPESDNDSDGVPDVSDSCPINREVVNGVNDHDGCPDEGLIEMVDDRIILEETILFDFERARVKSSATPVLQAIVDLYRQHPEWRSVRIEGHADVRGNTEFNLSVSQRRAAQVRRALVELGIPPEIIDSVGYGAARPRDQGSSEEAHRRNRRVEFVVLARHGSTTPGQRAPSEGEERPPELTQPVASEEPEEGVSPEEARRRARRAQRAAAQEARDAAQSRRTPSTQAPTPEPTPAPTTPEPTPSEDPAVMVFDDEGTP